MERTTRQRIAIRNVIEEAGRPLAPQEILDMAQQEVQSLGIATVYRNMKDLLREGWVTEVELPGDPVRYERSGKKEHHHFKCEDCGRVYDVPCYPHALEPVIPRDFSLKSHELFLYGLCDRCAS